MNSCIRNWRGDIVGIYNGNGDLRARYEYDSWGNVLSITDQNGSAITDENHIANLNPFRYRSYYMDAETGMYYLMSRYYDPVTHRFLNADGYFQTGMGILDANMNAYCGNNPIMNSDPTGTISSWEMQYDKLHNPNSPYTIEDIIWQRKIEEGYVMRTGNNNPRKDKRKGSENRQPAGLRERNTAHPNGEEHSRKAKGTKVRRQEYLIPTPDSSNESFEWPTLPDVGFDFKGIPDTGDKPIYEKIWDDLVRLFNGE